MRKSFTIVIVAVVVIAIIAFFYPKNAGSTCGFCPSPPAIQRTEYGCIGFKQEIHPDSGCIYSVDCNAIKFIAAFWKKPNCFQTRGCSGCFTERH